MIRFIEWPTRTVLFYYNHMQRFVERNISEEVAADVMQTAPVSYPGNTPDSTAYKKGNIVVIVGNKNGGIITAINTSLPGGSK